MDASREQLSEKLNKLPDDYLNELAEFIDFLFWKYEEYDTTRNGSMIYQAETDPLIGLFAGPNNLAEQSEEILDRDAKEHAGWTWKTL